MSLIRSALFLGMVVCAGAVVSLSQKPPGDQGNLSREQVLQLERDWLSADAKGDAASLRRIISDDFIGSSFDGTLLSKDDIIPQNSAPGGFAGAAPEQTNVRVFGDTAVLMGYITMGASRSDKIRVTLVCQKHLQTWQIIATQMAH